MAVQYNRKCKRCRQYFSRRKSESNYAFNRRQYCSRSCQVSAQNRERAVENRLWRSLTE